jgi:hypothetical protein
MSVIGAKERSEKHWHGLFVRAGIHVAKFRSSVGNAKFVIEAVL